MIVLTFLIQPTGLCSDAMAETQPIPDEPKQDSGIIRVLFKPGTSIDDMVEILVQLQAKAGKPGKEPPKPPD